MSIRVLFFASYADLIGRSDAELQTPGPLTVAQLLDLLRMAVPGAERIPPRPMVAVNQRHASMDTRVDDQDEVALLPPLAGG